MRSCDHMPDPLSQGPNGECLLCLREQSLSGPKAAEPPPRTDLDIRVPVDGVATSPAVVHEWLKQPGERLDPGSEVVILDRAGVRETLVAASAGTLGIHRARPGTTVPPNFVLVRVLPAPDDRQLAPKADEPAASGEAERPLVEEVPVPLAVDPLAAPPAAPIGAAAWPVEVPRAEVADSEEKSVAVSPDPVAPFEDKKAAPEADAAEPVEEIDDSGGGIRVEPGDVLDPIPNDESAAEESAAAAKEELATVAETKPAPLSEPEPESHSEPPLVSANMLSEDELVVAELAKLRREGVFIVSLVGFYEGGKTWFLQRLKRELARGGVWVDPPCAGEGDEVSRTNNFSVHRFRSRSSLGGAPQEFAIIDLPGETVSRLVRDPMRGPLALLAALNASGALIVALPADEVMLAASAAEAKQLMAAPDNALDDEQREQAAFFAERVKDPAYARRLDRLAEADRMLTDFTNELCNVTAMLSTMRALKVSLDEAPSHGRIDREQINAHVRSGAFVPFRTPTFIALTKADRITQLDPVGTDLLQSEDEQLLKEMQRDPRQLVIEHRETLAALLDHWFDHHKFDFVSAFEGHRGDTTIRYSRYRHRGIWGVIHWISWVRSTTPPNRWQIMAMQWARRVRNLRDGRISTILGGIGDRVDQ